MKGAHCAQTMTQVISLFPVYRAVAVLSLFLFCTSCCGGHGRIQTLVYSCAEAGWLNTSGGRISSLVVVGLAVHSVLGSILLWGNFLVEGIFPLELTWVQTPFPQKLFRMRV